MTTSKQHAGKDQTPVDSGQPSIWKSPLCTTVFSLALVIILLFVAGMLSLATENVVFFYFIPILFVAALYLLSVLLKQVQHNFLQPLNNLRKWSEEMLDDNHSARIPVKPQGEFTDIFKGINTRFYKIFFKI